MLIRWRAGRAGTLAGRFLVVIGAALIVVDVGLLVLVVLGRGGGV